MARRGVRAASERIRAEHIACVEHVVDVAAENLGCRIAEKAFRRGVPRAEFSIPRNAIRRVVCMLE
jgi:hypothetical protein